MFSSRHLRPGPRLVFTGTAWNSSLLARVQVVRRGADIPDAPNEDGSPADLTNGDRGLVVKPTSVLGHSVDVGRGSRILASEDVAGKIAVLPLNDDLVVLDVHNCRLLVERSGGTRSKC